MAYEFYDVSRPLHSRIGTWPGDVPLSIDQTFSQEQGDSVTVGRLEMSIHTGTHVDAPYHYDANGETTDQLDVSAFWGMVQVVSVQKDHGALDVPDLGDVDLIAAPRLLLHTSASELADENFPANIAYLSVRLVEQLASAGIILVGTDAPSVDALDDPHLPAHRALYRHRIAILEGLNLSGVPDGLYEIAALPLKIEQSDGSPVRAVLRREI